MLGENKGEGEEERAALEHGCSCCGACGRGGGGGEKTVADLEGCLRSHPPQPPPQAAGRNGGDHRAMMTKTAPLAWKGGEGGGLVLWV